MILCPPPPPPPPLSRPNPLIPTPLQRHLVIGHDLSSAARYRSAQHGWQLTRIGSRLGARRLAPVAWPTNQRPVSLKPRQHHHNAPLSDRHRPSLHLATPSVSAESPTDSLWCQSPGTDFNPWVASSLQQPAASRPKHGYKVVPASLH